MFVPAPDAFEQIVELAKPALSAAGDRIGPAIVEHVPVVHGGARRTYQPRVELVEDGVRVHVGSPFWHFLEYGTATSQPYRPVELGVRSLGLEYTPL